MNNKPEVSPETRELVLAAIDELGYRPSAAARSMVVGHTHMLGCISPSLIDYTFACIIESAQAEARALGYCLLAGGAPELRSVELLLEEMLHRQVDGLLVLNPCADDRCRLFEPLAAKGVPVIYLVSAPEEGPVTLIRGDDLDGGLQATRYLIGLGHRQIATILGPRVEKCTFDRLDGYRQGLAEVGVEPDPELNIRGDWSATSGYNAAWGLLGTGRPFTAIFAQNDQMAVGAIKALREAGRQVPADVSLIGYDDIPLASYFDPPLTTLRQPMQLFGQQAVQMLIEMTQQPNAAPNKVLLPAQLIVRGSCSPLVG